MTKLTVAMTLLMGLHLLSLANGCGEASGTGTPTGDAAVSQDSSQLPQDTGLSPRPDASTPLVDTGVPTDTGSPQDGALPPPVPDPDGSIGRYCSAFCAVFTRCGGDATGCAEGCPTDASLTAYKSTFLDGVATCYPTMDCMAEGDPCWEAGYPANPLTVEPGLSCKTKIDSCAGMAEIPDYACYDVHVLKPEIAASIAECLTGACNTISECIYGPAVPASAPAGS